MSGRLPANTGSGMLGDHRRRLEGLERPAGPDQVDLRAFGKRFVARSGDTMTGTLVASAGIDLLDALLTSANAPGVSLGFDPGQVVVTGDLAVLSSIVLSGDLHQPGVSPMSVSFEADGLHIDGSQEVFVNADLTVNAPFLLQAPILEGVGGAASFGARLRARNNVNVLSFDLVGSEVRFYSGDTHVASSGGTGEGAATPSGTVSPEFAWGIAASAGSAASYSRGDHTHGTPNIGGAPTDNVFGVVGSAGASGTPARSDHRHFTPALADDVTPQFSFGMSSTSGTGDLPARWDHTHGTPPAPSVPSAGNVVAENVTFGTTAVSGSSPSYSRADHRHGNPVLNYSVIVEALDYFPLNQAGGTVTGNLGVNGVLVAGTIDTNLVRRSGFLEPSIEFTSSGLIFSGTTFAFGRLVVGGAGGVLNAPVVEGGVADSGAKLRGRTGHVISFEWSGGSLLFYVDDVYVGEI